MPVLRDRVELRAGDARRNVSRSSDAKGASGSSVARELRDAHAGGVGVVRKSEHRPGAAAADGAAAAPVAATGADGGGGAAGGGGGGVPGVGVPAAADAVPGPVGAAAAVLGAPHRRRA